MNGHWLGLALLGAMVLPVAGQAQTDWALDRHWDISLGGGVDYGPTYEGADSLRPMPIPYFDIEWNDRLSLSSDDGLHFAVVNRNHLAIGLAGNWRLPRKRSDDSALRHLDRIGWAVEAGGYIDYNPPGFDVSLEIRHDIAGAYGGTVAEFNMRGQVPLGPSAYVEFGPNLNWASGNYMQTYFGITPAQAARSGLAAFRPHAGVKDVGFTVDGGYAIAPHWRLLAEADYARLLGAVDDSPLIRDKGDANQYSFSLALAYRF